MQLVNIFSSTPTKSFTQALLCVHSVYLKLHINQLCAVFGAWALKSSVCPRLCAEVKSWFPSFIPTKWAQSKTRVDLKINIAAKNLQQKSTTKQTVNYL